MRVPKPLLYANAATLILSEIILALMAERVLPPLLGLALLVAFITGSLWLSAWAQRKTPKRMSVSHFRAAPAERIETLQR